MASLALESPRTVILNPDPEVVPRTIPWEDKPHGVVSLLDMLRFYAEKFLKVTRVSQELCTELKYSSHEPEASQPIAPELQQHATNTLVLLRNECDGLMLASGVDQVNRMILRVHNGATVLAFGGLLQEFHNRVEDELARKIIYCIESDRELFCNPVWLIDSPIATKFPTAFKEVQSAGRSYAFGEAPASAFHSMRALEVGLRVLAVRFSVGFDRTNWHPVIEEIERKIRDISQAPTTPQRQEDEKFFGGLARHFMFLKNGWRNHVMHVREVYSDREARQMLDHVTDLLTDMSQKFSE